jgi:hypothetical protein
VRTPQAVFGWVCVYVKLVPAPDADRRRRELASHLWESDACGTSPLRLLVEAVLGVPADLGWCHAARRRSGQPRLLVVALASPSAATAAAVGLVLLGLVLSVSSSEPTALRVRLCAYVAIGLLAASTVLRRLLMWGR